MNKFNIGQTVFAFCELNADGEPFIQKFVIEGIEKDGEIILYKNDAHSPHYEVEDYLFESQKEAYNFIINKCKEELNKLS